MSVLVATPCYGGMVMDNYFRSMLTLRTDAMIKGVRMDVLTIAGESLITRARNKAVATFLEGDWEHLLFIDGDIGFEPENAWRLLESGHPVCATPYPLKRLDWESASVARTPEEARQLSIETVTNFVQDTPIGEDGFAECLDAGTGFMLIRRDAIIQMIEAHPETAYHPEGESEKTWHALFDCIIRDGRYLSEDYTFCRRWQDLGGKVMVDMTGPALLHRGLYEYGEA